MRTEIVTLCEYASETQGRLTIVDTFDTVRAAKLPWREYFYAVAKIVFDKQDCWPSKIGLIIVKDDRQGEPIFETYSQNKPMDSPAYANKKLNIVAGFKGLIFDSEGDYSFIVKFDNDVVLSHPFKVRLEYEGGNG